MNGAEKRLIANPLNSNILLTFASGQLNLQDLAPLFHDSLLLSKPAIKGNPLGEVGVVDFPLGARFFRAGDAGCDLEETHENDSRSLDGLLGLRRGKNQFPKPELM